MASAAITPEFEKATYAKVAGKLIPFLFICYIVAFLDRVNVGFAKLQMAGDLKFSDEIYALGAGLFFIGYFIFEVPSNVILEKVGARVWIARIMITWGLISAAFMFTGDIHWGAFSAPLCNFFLSSAHILDFGFLTGKPWPSATCNDAEVTFYFLRFWLGVAEAGFFPGIILYLTYWFPGHRRAKMVAMFMTAIAISNAFGSPLSGAIMEWMDGVNQWRGWQWLFLLEGIPSIIIGVMVFWMLPNGPKSARWLTPQESDFIVKRVEEDDAGKKDHGHRHSFGDAFKDGRVWAFAAVYLCGVVCFYAINFWMPTIIQELGIDKKDYLKVGLYSMIPWGAGAIAMVLWGAHSDRTGERRWHAAGGLMCAIAGMILLAAAGKNVVPAMLGLTLAAVGLLSWVVTFWSLPTAFLTGTAAAAGIAWINSIGNLGGHYGPILLGKVRTAYKNHPDANLGNEVAFYTLAAVAFVGVLIILFMPQRRAESVSGLAPARSGRHG